MDNLPGRLTSFYNSLGEFKAEHHPSAATGDMFNALIAAAKEQLPDDPVIASIPQVTQRPSHDGAISKTDAGTMRAALDQVLSAMGESGPNIA